MSAIQVGGETVDGRDASVEQLEEAAEVLLDGVREGQCEDDRGAELLKNVKEKATAVMRKPGYTEYLKQQNYGLSAVDGLG